MEKWYQQGVINQDTRLYIVVGGRKWTKGKSYSWKEWMELPIADLELLGRMGSKLSGIYKGDQTEEMVQDLRETIKEEIRTGLLK